MKEKEKENLSNDQLCYIKTKTICCNLKLTVPRYFKKIKVYIFHVKQISFGGWNIRALPICLVPHLLIFPT